MNHEKMTKEELEGLCKVGKYSKSWVGEHVCIECISILSNSFNCGFHHIAACAKCGHEAMVYEVLTEKTL